jgi:aldehyde:ferredoxin oxidoreductase
VGNDRLVDRGDLKKRHQDPLLRVSSIGRAGENQVLFAAIVNDLHRAAGRSGVGAVMGSKNLKASPCAAPRRRQHRRCQGLHGGRDRRQEGARRERGHRPGPADLRHAGADERDQRDGRLADAQSPRRQFEGARKISAEAMHEKRATDGRAHLVTNQACFGCTIACGRISQHRQGSLHGPEQAGILGGQRRTRVRGAWALGANGVDDLEALQYANLLCNEDGMDPISFGATVGAVMELYELGILSKEEIGLEAPFGSAEGPVPIWPR